MRRLKFAEQHIAAHQQCPTDYGEDNFTSKKEEINLEKPTIPRSRPPVPGDFVLTFSVLALADDWPTVLKSQFPYRSEYWWTQLPGSLDQACMCFLMEGWVEQLSSCKDEESFLTAYQSFLDTTWQAIEGHVQCTSEFPLQKPTEIETRRAYYMKNKTLILHNEVVWGEGAEEDKPVIPQQGQQPQRQQSRQRGASLARSSGSIRGVGLDGDDEDPNKRKSNANPPRKGDEAQDKEKKKTQEASHDDEGQKEKTSAEQERDEALDKIKRLQEQLEKERQQRKDEQEAARQAADDQSQEKGRRTCPRGRRR